MNTLIWLVAVSITVVASTETIRREEIGTVNEDSRRLVSVNEGHSAASDNEQSRLEDHAREKRDGNDRPYYKRRVPPGLIGLGGFRSFGKGYAVRGRGFGYPSRGLGGRNAGGRSGSHGVGHGAGSHGGRGGHGRG